MSAGSPISLSSAIVAVTAIGALYALHHLRSQPQRQRVATVMFWGSSVRARQTRVPWSRRFSHLWTFLFLSTIAATLALALSADRWVSDRDARATDVVVVDVGAAMAAAGDDGRTLLREAADQIRADVGRMRRTPKLIVAGPQPALLSGGDEPSAVLGRRLDAMAVSLQGSAPLLALQLAAQVSDENESTIEWYTAGKELPAGILSATAGRVRLHRLKAAGDTAVIVGATFEADNDQATSGTLRIKVAGQFREALSLVVKDQNDVIVRQTTIAPQTGPSNVTLPGMTADGRELRISLKDAPGSPLEHAVSLRLPRQPELQFYISGSISAPLRSAILAVGHVAESARNSIVVVGKGTAVPDGGIGVIEVVSSSTTHAPCQISVAGGAAERLREINFEGATALGIAASGTGGVPVLMAGDAPAATLTTAANGQRLCLASSLVDESADLPRHAAFPVLIGRLAQSMSGWRPGTAAVSQTRHALDPLWQSETGVSFIYDVPDTKATDAGSLVTPPAAAARNLISWMPFLIVVCLALGVTEGILVARKKMI